MLSEKETCETRFEAAAAIDMQIGISARLNQILNLGSSAKLTVNIFNFFFIQEIFTKCLLCARTSAEILGFKNKGIK